MTDVRFSFLTARDGAERTAELARFLDYWFGSGRPEYGEPEDRLASQSLPDPLRSFYGFAGRRPSPEPDRMDPFYTGAGGHHLRELDAVERRPDGRLVFFHEYQGDWEGLTLDSGDDPPVWLSGWLREGDESERTIKVCAQLSKFLITHCLMTIVYEAENAPCTHTTRRGPVVDYFNEYPIGTPWGPVLLWNADDLDWPPSVLDYRGSFYTIPFADILVHRYDDWYRFAALRPTGIRVLVGQLERGLPQ